MLLKDFYEIIEVTKEEDGVYVAKVELNGAHEIFGGHFPGEPVVPGVCLIQMTKEIVEHVLERALMLSEAKSIKFLNVVRPEENSRLNVKVTIKPEDEGLKVVASIFAGETTFFKQACRFTD
ncbi:3-hydroxyacyl-ACP dehydratase [Thermodesulfobacteriota bacterium]